MQIYKNYFAVQNDEPPQTVSCVWSIQFAINSSIKDIRLPLYGNILDSVKMIEVYLGEFSTAFFGL